MQKTFKPEGTVEMYEDKQAVRRVRNSLLFWLSISALIFPGTLPIGT